MNRHTRIAAICLAALAPPAGAARAAEEDSAELAKKLSNPVAAMISVPFQYNYDENYGPDHSGRRSNINLQPVIPFGLSDNWNLISRTILPMVDQSGVVPGSSESGIGDITQSFFFVPKAPTSSGLIWGAGPVLLLPTGSSGNLSARKWGAGPTAVLLKQEGAWTYGALVNHIWGVGGNDARPDVSNTLFQPFLAHTTKDAWTFSVNAESTYDWKASKWTVPVNLTVSKLVKFGNQPVSFGGGVRYWATGPDSGPHDWGFRFTVTFLLPK